MELYSSHFITFGLLFVLTLFVFRLYLNFKKKCSGFPFSHILPSLIYSHITGKISIDAPLNNVSFQKLIQVGKHHMKEGLFMFYATRPVLVIFSGEAIKVFANEKACADKPPEYKLLEEFLGAGIETSNGERWKKHRKIINPVFHMGILKEKVPLFNEHAMALVKDMQKLAGKPSVHILESLKWNYICALSESILGLKQSKENKAKILKFTEFIDSMTALFVKRLFCPWLRPRFILECFPSGRKYYEQIKEFDDFLNNLLFDMQEYVCSKKTMDTEYFGNYLRKSFAYLLLKRHMEDSSFTYNDLHSEAKTMIGAAYDTASYATMWCLFLLGLHPEVQEKALSEVLSTTSDFITYEESSNLVYLESVIMETLRLYPTIPIFARNASEDIPFGKYKVLKDTTITFFLYLTNRDPEIFPDPEVFRPERFLSGDLKKSKNFIPFSEGRRSCIGKNYALIEMKIFLAHILRNFQITSLDKREDVDLCWAVVLTPVKPLRIKITQRYCTLP